MDANEYFEKFADAFYRATGHLPPGKDGCPREDDGTLRADVERELRLWNAAAAFGRNEVRDNILAFLKSL